MQQLNGFGCSLSSGVHISPVHTGLGFNHSLFDFSPAQLWF